MSGTRTWRRDGSPSRVPRPTRLGIALFTTAVALALLGTALDMASLITAALATLVAVALGFVAVAAPRGWARAALTEASTRGGGWARIARDGSVRELVHAEETPARRGVWTWRGTRIRTDHLRLWVCPDEQERRRERAVPPRDPRQAPPCEAISGAPIRTADEPEIASVRRYEPGDPLRQVAWRQSAHHSRLMSFELRGAEGQAALVLLDTLDGRDADALAQTAWHLTRSLRAETRVLVTDGVETCDGRACARMLAQLETDDGQEKEEDGYTTTGDRSETGSQAEERLREVASLARRLATQGNWRVILVTDARDGELERALRRGRLGARSEVARATHEEDCARDTPSSAGRLAAGRRRKGLESSLEACAPLVACCLCLGLMLSYALQLVRPGAWTPFCAVALTAAALCATLSPRRHRAMRALLGALLCCAAAAVWAAASLHAETGVWPSDLATGLGTAMTSPRASHGGTGPLAQVAALLACAQAGVASLYEQWVPLSPATPEAGVTCILAAGGAAALVRLLLAAPATRPLVAVLTLLAQGACTTYLDIDATPLGTLVPLACGLALVHAIPTRDDRPHRRGREPGDTSETMAPSRAGRAMATALVIAACCAVALGLGHRAASALSGLGLGVNLRGSFLSGSSVNPLVDLSRNLQANSNDAAFAYTTTFGEPIYLRLATLDDFDGATWSLTDEAGVDPALPGTFVDGSTLVSGSTPPVDGFAEEARTTVTLRTLSSTFAPTPTNVHSSTAAAGSTDSWSWTVDGTLRTQGRGTRPNMSYTVTGLYVRPIGTEGQATQTLSALGEGLGSNGNIDASVLARYLALPDKLPAAVSDVVTQAGAEGLTLDTFEADGPSSGPDARDGRAMTWLVSWFERGSFTYSLTAPGGDGANNLEVIDAFLQRRSGYCTHFATSLAVLARALGVPSRVAIGYSAAERAGDGSYVATNRSLHAWCEAYLGGIGWVPFDVTPGFAQEMSADQAVTRPTTSDAAAATSTATTSAVTAPEAQDASSTTASTEASQTPGAAATNGASMVPDDSPPASQDPSSLGNTISKLGRIARRAAPWALGAACTLAVLCTPALVRRHRRATRRRAIRRGRRPHSAAWEELCACALDAGLILPESATELEQAELIAADLEDECLARKVRQLARDACNERYALTPRHSPDARETIRLLDELAGALAHLPHVGRLRRMLLPRSVLSHLPTRGTGRH